MKHEIVLIAAVCATGYDKENHPDFSKDWAIGNRGVLPFKCPEDMKRFRELTLGHHVVMGRKTFESCGVLDGRRMYVVSSNPDYAVPEGVTLCPTLYAAVRLSQLDSETDDTFTYIAGGANVFEQALEDEIPDSIDLTFLHTVCQHYDKVFPKGGINPETASLCNYALCSLDITSYGTIARYELEELD